MARPTVLVVDDDAGRRKQLTRSLAELGYEAVAAAGAEEGIRFAAGLTPAVIVAAASLEGFGDASVLDQVTPEEGEPPVLLVLLVEDGTPAAETAENVFPISIKGLTAAGILRKVRTGLLGRELGLDADERLESLVGDFQMVALFDLLPLLQRSVFTGRLMLDEGEIAIVDGAVVSARVGKARGVKAFSRLGRAASRGFRLLLGAPGAEPEITEDLLSLMAIAMEDQHQFEDALSELPDWRSLVDVEMGPKFFGTQFTPAQQTVLQACHGGRSIPAVVDAVPHLDGEVAAELVRLHSLGFVTLTEPEAQVTVVTDSTADLAPELVRELGIQVVPLSVIFGEEIYRDGVDITPGGFYKMLQARKDAHPRTSPPSKGEFASQYRVLVARKDVVSVHISEKMSLTVVHAREARAEGAGEYAALRAEGSAPEVEVVDATQVSAGLGLLVICAARMAQRNLTAREIADRVRAMRERFHLLFVVDTMEYLARGGRIGKARALLGGLLGIKPILGLVGGEVSPVDRVRGGKAAHPKVVEIFKERVDPEKPVIVAVAHAAAPIWAERLRSLIEERFVVSEMLQGEIGPVVGAHAGPGCVGAVMFQPSEDEAKLIAPLPAHE